MKSGLFLHFNVEVLILGSVLPPHGESRTRSTQIELFGLNLGTAHCTLFFTGHILI